LRWQVIHPQMSGEQKNSGPTAAPELAIAEALRRAMHESGDIGPRSTSAAVASLAPVDRSIGGVIALEMIYAATSFTRLTQLKASFPQEFDQQLKLAEQMSVSQEGSACLRTLFPIKSAPATGRPPLIPSAPVDVVVPEPAPVAQTQMISFGDWKGELDGVLEFEGIPISKTEAILSAFDRGRLSPKQREGLSLVLNYAMQVEIDPSLKDKLTVHYLETLGRVRPREPK